MKLCVNKSRQTGSMDYVVKFDADMELRDDCLTVEVEIVSEADRYYAEEARDAIRRGAEEALTPRGLGASIRVNQITLHEVDFSPMMHERFTREEVQRILEAK